MSMQRVGTRRVAQLRELAHGIAGHPQVQQARTSIRLGDLGAAIERAIRDLYAGEQLRVYISRAGAEARTERAQRIRAMAAPPEGMSTQRIAEIEGISQRQVQRALLTTF
jgi:ABC-type hemin transport system ATPase subunit